MCKQNTIQASAGRDVNGHLLGSLLLAIGQESSGACPPAGRAGAVLAKCALPSAGFFIFSPLQEEVLTFLEHPLFLKHSLKCSTARESWLG